MTERPRQQSSYSELSALAQCEWKWHWLYGLGNDGPSTQPMVLGTIMHRAIADWHGYRPWDVSLADAFAGVENDVSQETRDTAVWLMQRYDEHYYDSLSHITVKDHEIELRSWVWPDKAYLLGYLDGLYEIDGKTYIVERKTYKTRRRLDLLGVDPQLQLYVWLARQNGLDVDGVMWDGICTYRWKGETEPARSFDRLILHPTQEQLDAALAWAVAGLRRRKLLRGNANPIRNIGPSCLGCPAREDCYAGMGQHPIVIEGDHD